jgi:hypothetical protein
LLIDSGAVKGIYGHLSKKQQLTINVPSLDSYSSLFINLKGIADSTAIVELLDNSDKPVRKVRSNKGRAEFYFVKPGHYYVRLFIDKNGNGIWDPGDFEHDITPEETYYYPTQLNLRALWDVEQDWDFRAMPLTRQKPIQITKQKPDKGKTIRKRNAEREKNRH